MENKTLISVPDLFRKSFDIYKPRIWTMLLLGLTGWLGSVVVMAVFGVASFATLITGRGLFGLHLLTVFFMLIGMLLVIAINAWVQVTLLYYVKEENMKMGVKALLMSVQDKMPSYYWVVFLNAIIVIAGFILFIIPGIIFSVWLSMSQFAFVFEGLKGGKALSRSKELVKGYWWPVLGRLLLLVVLAAIVSSISKLGFLVNSLFTMPYGLVYLYVLYQDLKRIKA